jgi:hypothetical protein
MKTQIKKQKSHAFGKDIFLLGIDKDKVKYWLESPSWECQWYWGFGYVKTYTNNNNNPSIAKDTNSHEHINGFLGQQEKYDYDKNCFIKSKFIYNLIDSPIFESTTFSEKESWELTELFKQFYLIKEMAEFCHKDLPGCNIITSPVNHGNLKDWEEKINKEMIPLITTKIIEILTPN